MLKNYLKVTLRNLKKNSIYSFINIFGLAVGILCSLLILLWVFDELSFDRFHPKVDRLYQVWVNSTYDGKVHSWNSVPLPTYEGMKTGDPSIVNSVVTDWGGDHLLAVGEQRINKRAFFASEEFLNMFEFPVLKGSVASSLNTPSTIVLTESAAKALFGDHDPMGQVVMVDNEFPLKVSAILKNIPKNSSFQFECLLPWKLNETRDWVKRNKDNWGNYSFQVFVELDKASGEVVAENSIREMLTKHGEVDIKHEFFLHPLERWRLHSNFENGVENGGMIEYVESFTVIATFILIIACINFMNLSTARSESRAREVGIRKTVGSRKHELIFQFIGESLIISLIAFILAVLMAQLLLPFYNDLVEKQLQIGYNDLKFWLFGLGLIFVTGILSGSYPAFYLSSFQPVKVLKGKIQIGKGASLPRKILVTIQFGFSILLIIGTLVIYAQIQHLKSRDLGYSQENLITIDNTTEIEKSYRVIKTELLRTGVVSSVTKSNSPITNIYSNNFLGWPGKPESQKVLFATIATEFDYTKTMGIKLLDGRDFSENFKSDTAGILINKAALDIMSLKDPIGQQLDLWGKKRQLLGVIDNVLMGSPNTPIGPMFIVLEPDWVSAITIRLEKSSDIQSSIKKVEEVFRKYNPAYPFEYSFVDVEFAKKFTTINMTGRLASLFALLAMVITGLGLFGLAAYTAEQRTREIGIRKVLGASVSGLVAMMSKDFSLLVILAFGISSPVAWFLLDRFVLQRYPYHVDMPWWAFPLTGGVALLFAILIVSTQALRAARANPANSLRIE